MFHRFIKISWPMHTHVMRDISFRLTLELEWANQKLF